MCVCVCFAAVFSSYLYLFFFAELLHIAGITTLQTPGGSSPLGPSSAVEQRNIGEEATRHASDILDSSSFELKLDKSNILMLGPTGTGCYAVCCHSIYIVYIWHLLMYIIVLPHYSFISLLLMQSVLVITVINSLWTRLRTLSFHNYLIYFSLDYFTVMLLLLHFFYESHISMLANKCQLLFGSWHHQTTLLVVLTLLEKTLLCFAVFLFGWYLVIRLWTCCGSVFSTSSDLLNSWLAVGLFTCREAFGHKAGNISSA